MADLKQESDVDTERQPGKRRLSDTVSDKLFVDLNNKRQKQIVEEEGTEADAKTHVLDCALNALDSNDAEDAKEKERNTKFLLIFVKDCKKGAQNFFTDYDNNGRQKDRVENEVIFFVIPPCWFCINKSSKKKRKVQKNIQDNNSKYSIEIMDVDGQGIGNAHCMGTKIKEIEKRTPKILCVLVPLCKNERRLKKSPTIYKSNLNTLLHAPSHTFGNDKPIFYDLCVLDNFPAEYINVTKQLELKKRSTLRKTICRFTKHVLYFSAFSIN